MMVGKFSMTDNPNSPSRLPIVVPDQSRQTVVHGALEDFPVEEQLRFQRLEQVFNAGFDAALRTVDTQMAILEQANSQSDSQAEVQKQRQFSRRDLIRNAGVAIVAGVTIKVGLDAGEAALEGLGTASWKVAQEGYRDVKEKVVKRSAESMNVILHELGILKDDCLKIASRLGSDTYSAVNEAFQEAQKAYDNSLRLNESNPANRETVLRGVFEKFKAVLSAIKTFMTDLYYRLSGAFGEAAHDLFETIIERQTAISIEITSLYNDLVAVFGEAQRQKYQDIFLNEWWEFFKEEFWKELKGTFGVGTAIPRVAT